MYSKLLVDNRIVPKFCKNDHWPKKAELKKNLVDWIPTANMTDYPRAEMNVHFAKYDAEADLKGSLNKAEENNIYQYHNFKKGEK